MKGQKGKNIDGHLKKLTLGENGTGNACFSNMILSFVRDQRQAGNRKLLNAVRKARVFVVRKRVIDAIGNEK